MCTDFHFNWVAFYPMKKKSDMSEALELLISNHGAFNNIIPDNAPELISSNFKQTANKFGIHIHPVEAWMSNQNKAEACIRELKQSFRRAMRKTNAPTILWDHCFQLMAKYVLTLHLISFLYKGTHLLLI